MDYEAFLEQEGYRYKVGVQPAATADIVGTGISKIGTFTHESFPEDADSHGSGDSHVLYHHVRDLLYPLGIIDMQRVDIEFIR